MRAEKEGVGESQLSWDSIITNKGHMRCNRWAISTQRKQLLATGHQNHSRTSTSEKEGWVPVKPEPKQQEREHVRAQIEEVGVGPS